MPAFLNRTAWAAALAATLFTVGCSKTTEPTAGTPTMPPASAQTADADVSTNVTTALLREEVLRGLNIGVVTIKGDVRLTGVVDNQAQIDRAVEIARAATGAHSIHNELTLKP
jgi:hyperosmotically inducible periplasmic protein